MISARAYYTLVDPFLIFFLFFNVFSCFSHLWQKKMLKRQRLPCKPLTSLSHDKNNDLMMTHTLSLWYNRLMSFMLCNALYYKGIWWHFVIVVMSLIRLCLWWKINPLNPSYNKWFVLLSEILIVQNLD